MNTSPKATRRVEDGVFAVEAAIAAPVLLLAVLLLQLGWRIQTAQGDVHAAATRAARAASQHQNPATAAAAARSAAVSVLADREVTCVSMNVTMTGDMRPGSVVTVKVDCVTDLSDLTLLKVPGSRTTSATVTEIVDRYRGATP